MSLYNKMGFCVLICVLAFNQLCLWHVCPEPFILICIAKLGLETVQKLTGIIFHQISAIKKLNETCLLLWLHVNWIFLGVQSSVSFECGTRAYLCCFANNSIFIESSADHWAIGILGLGLLLLYMTCHGKASNSFEKFPLSRTTKIVWLLT